jgi:hypothetical protein
MSSETAWKTPSRVKIPRDEQAWACEWELRSKRQSIIGIVKTRCTYGEGDRRGKPQPGSTSSTLRSAQAIARVASASRATDDDLLSLGCAVADINGDG